MHVPLGCNSGWSDHSIQSIGAAACQLQPTPPDSSLYCCDPRIQPHTYDSATWIILKWLRTLSEIHFRATSSMTIWGTDHQVEGAYGAVPWACVQQSIMDLHSIHCLLVAFELAFSGHITLPWIWSIWEHTHTYIPVISVNIHNQRYKVLLHNTMRHKLNTNRKWKVRWHEFAHSLG